MKHIISMTLCLTLLLSAVTITPATAAAETNETSTMSFLDGEGKTNTVKTSFLRDGTCHVEYYIDGVLAYVSDAVVNDEEQVVVRTTDCATGTTQMFEENISDVQL